MHIKEVTKTDKSNGNKGVSQSKTPCGINCRSIIISITSNFFLFIFIIIIIPSDVKDGVKQMEMPV